MTPSLTPHGDVAAELEALALADTATERAASGQIGVTARISMALQCALNRAIAAERDAGSDEIAVLEALQMSAGNMLAAMVRSVTSDPDEAGRGLKLLVIQAYGMAAEIVVAPAAGRFREGRYNVPEAGRG